MDGFGVTVAINPIDILLVIVIVLSVLNGYRRGFVHGVLDLAGWVLSLLAGLRYYEPVALWFGPRIDVWSEVWDRPIAFVLIAVVVGLVGGLAGSGSSAPAVTLWLALSNTIPT